VYRIYLPPCYDDELERFYPVLYLIHGQTYTDAQWEDLGVPQVINRKVASGESSPFIVVLPWDRSWLEPTKDNFGQAVTQTLIPWVDEKYRTIPEREYRAIGGLSRGGAWAVHLGLSHPEIFSAVGIHSGFVFHTDVQALDEWLAKLPEAMVPRIYMDIADHDRPEIAESARWLEGKLTQNDIPHEWHMFVGEHEQEYWQAHVQDYLRWYSLEWGREE
jgi:enterochelin esterase-like enzyme